MYEKPPCVFENKNKILSCFEREVIYKDLWRHWVCPFCLINMQMQHMIYRSYRSRFAVAEVRMNPSVDAAATLVDQRPIAPRHQSAHSVDCSSSAFWACPPSPAPGLKLCVPSGWGESCSTKAAVSLLIARGEGGVEGGAAQMPCDERSFERRFMSTYCCILFNRAELTWTGSWGFISPLPACCCLARSRDCTSNIDHLKLHSVAYCKHSLISLVPLLNTGEKDDVIRERTIIFKWRVHLTHCSFLRTRQFEPILLAPGSQY